MLKTKRYKRLFFSDRHRLTALGIVLISVLAVALITGAVTLSKYVMQSRRDALAAAAGFYLQSDYLVSGGTDYDVYDWQNGFIVKLCNYEGVNVSSVNIGYTVTVTGASAQLVDGTLVENAGTISKGSSNEALLKITPTGGVGSEVTVSVATTPYNKPLSATFVLKDCGENSICKYESMGNYGTLTIKTGNSPAEDVTIHYGNLAPDNTDPRMCSWINCTSGKLTNLSANSTYKLIFFGNKSSTGEMVFTDSVTIP